MWYLTSKSDKRVIYVLERKQTVTIGRHVEGNNCDFTIVEDASISRKHATLLISGDDLFVKDLGSKYGTYVNQSDKIEHNKLIKLNKTDIIRFGKMNCIWNVTYINFVTCISTLKGENVQNLRKFLDILGGTLKTEWDVTCSFLTMPAITLTIKVVLALVQTAHIVSIDYWRKCVEAVDTNIVLPDPNNFIPHILESTLNKESVSFKPHKDRCTLFAGKKVFFFSRRQLEMYKTVLLKSSANALLLSESKVTKAELCEEDVIVIQYNITSISQETQAQRDLINEIIDYLKSKEKRIVADAEIGLAILYCSTNKYCNPAFNFPSEIIKQVPQQNTTSKNILAPESQDSSENLCQQSNIFIDESLTPNVHSTDNANSSKRKLSDDYRNKDINNGCKKLATETISVTSNKRQNDFNDLVENTSKKIAVTIEDEGDVFNCIKTEETNVYQNESNKKLNLLKPLKRKHRPDDDEDNLFNFVNKNSKKVAVDKSISTDVKSITINDTAVNDIGSNKENKSQNDDLQVARGSKLEELMINNLKIECFKQIKKENTSDADEKYCSIDFGSTNITIKKDLIVKKEKIQIQALECGVKNFKKFKKVWPIKCQVTIVPSTVKFV